MDKETSVALFVLSLRGTLAAAFQRRCMVPTDHEWQMLGGYREITARDIGEICYRLDVEPIFTVAAAMPNTEDAAE